MKKIAVAFLVGLIVGVFVGKVTHGKRLTEVHAFYSKTYDLVRGECSKDGQTWYPMRKDGICYAVDAPPQASDANRAQ